MNLKDIIKAKHLESYLEDEYGVKILNKYGVYLIITKENKLVDYFYTIREVKAFLEERPDFEAVMVQNGFKKENYTKEKEAEDTSEEE